MRLLIFILSNLTLAEALCAGVFTRHLDRNVVRLAELLFVSLRVGGGLNGIRKMALIGCKSACGGFPSNISITVIPRLQTTI
jgi:hypothetical protein